MSDSPTPQHLEQIHGHLFAGRKINAIKLYREATGVGLKEAKDAVEAMADDLYQRSPEQFTRDPKAKGCGATVLLLLVVGAAVAVAGFNSLRP